MKGRKEKESRSVEWKQNESTSENKSRRACLTNKLLLPIASQPNMLTVQEVTSVVPWTGKPSGALLIARRPP
jgi:hypothetical protein